MIYECVDMREIGDPNGTETERIIRACWRAVQQLTAEEKQRWRALCAKDSARR